MTSYGSLRDLRRSAIAACVLLVVFAALYSWQSWRDINERDQRQMSVLVDISANAVELYFRNVEGSMMSVGETMLDARGRFDEALAVESLRRLRRAHPRLGTSLVTRPDGRVLASTEPRFPKEVPSLAERPGFRRALDELERLPLSVGRAFQGPVGGGWLIPIFYAVRDARAELQYLVVTALPADAAQNLWRDAELSRGAALGVVREDGFLVARAPISDKVELAEVYGKAQTIGSAELAKRPGKAGEFRARSELTRLENVIVFRRLQRVPLAVYAAHPVANRRAEWLDSVWVLWAFGAAAIAGLAAIYYWSRRRQLAWDAEREQRMGDLERANRELETFNYTVTHDLRAPLRAISSFGALLRERSLDRLDAESRGFLERIIAASKRMSVQVDHLLGLARISRQPVTRETVELSRLAEDIIAELRAGEPAREVDVAIAPGLVTQGDPALLRTALQNLLENAWKFTGKAARARIEVGAHAIEEGTAYYVTDNGAGFDMHYADKLFHVFERLHGEEDYPGNGIGLAVVDRVVRRHGGRAWARSAPGQGATFSFTLGQA